MKKLLCLISILSIVSPVFGQYCDPPGEYVGETGYPVQSSGVAANRIAYDSQGGTHITWMAGTSIFERGVRFNFRDETGQWLSSDGMPVNEVNGAGYPTLALTADNTTAVAYHNMSNGYINLAVDAFRGMGIFQYFDPPDNMPGGNNAFWPQVAISTNGDIHIIMVEHTQEQGEYPSILYSRSENGGSTWTDPVVVAEVALLNGIITASSDGKVAILFLNPVISGEFSQVKNDVCYFVSEDGRMWDFRSPDFITDYGNDEQEIYCPWGFDAVFDNEGNMHFTWVTGHIDDDGYFIDEVTQLWHFSEQTGVINQIAESSDPLLDCMYGAVTLPISMPSISYSDFYLGALEIIYVGYDETDASAEGECVGDLYMVYGIEDGMAWSGPYNITETHSPDCAPGDCLSENFPSTAENMYDYVHLTYVMQKRGDDADTIYYMPVLVPIGDDISEENGLPGSFELLGNYPNPFNVKTTIEFELYEDSDVNLAVYDITGAVVEVLHDGYLESGKQSIAWNAEDVASGAYFYKLATAEGSHVKKMVLLK